MSLSSAMPCEAACSQLCLNFANAIDARDDDRCAEVFAPHSIFDHLTGRITGRDGVKAMLAARPAGVVTRHLCTNIGIERIGTTKAKGRCYVAVFRAASDDGKLPLPPVMPLVVEYHDEYELIDGSWYITYRKTVPVFV